MFAHNGQLKGIKKWPLDYYRTIGSTDSEHAFCWMMEHIRKAFPVRPQRIAQLWKLIKQLALELDELGTFNFLMSDSRYLYAYCSTKLCWLTRRHPFGKARLIDTGQEIDFSLETTPRDVVTVIASSQLTDNETWIAMDKGSLLVFHNGVVHAVGDSS